ncbi:hypothetical protein T492DRAFT_975163 [Pavlovales sp. CCMP2436]|nr:hypothetical protein T492DRAFT_975163 [Pavlovales sp. CCMP2436]
MALVYSAPASKAAAADGTAVKASAASLQPSPSSKRREPSPSALGASETNPRSQRARTRTSAASPSPDLSSSSGSRVGASARARSVVPPGVTRVGASGLLTTRRACRPTAERAAAAVAVPIGWGGSWSSTRYSMHSPSSLPPLPAPGARVGAPPGASGLPSGSVAGRLKKRAGAR